MSGSEQQSGWLEQRMYMQTTHNSATFNRISQITHTYIRSYVDLCLFFLCVKLLQLPVVPGPGQQLGQQLSFPRYTIGMLGRPLLFMGSEIGSSEAGWTKKTDPVKTEEYRNLPKTWVEPTKHWLGRGFSYFTTWAFLRSISLFQHRWGYLKLRMCRRYSKTRSPFLSATPWAQSKVSLGVVPIRSTGSQRLLIPKRCSSLA